MEKNKQLTVTIVGGGSSAHVLIPFLHDFCDSICLLTSRPEAWSSEILSKYQNPSGDIEKEFHGRIDIVSSSPEDVIPQADIVVLCLPVNAYRTTLHQIAPHISKTKEVFIGTVYGQGGFNWMMEEIIQRFNLCNIIYFAIGLIPWICRTIEYGKEGVTYGPKDVNVVALSSKDRFDFFNNIFLKNICEIHFDKGGFVLADNFLSLTLSLDNQIIHPSRCFGLYLQSGGKWARLEEVPLFYRDYDELSAALLKDLDHDYSLIRESIKSRYPHLSFTYMLDYLALERLSYNSSNTDIKKSFVTSPTLGTITTPVIQEEDGGWILNKNNRFFSDDIHYGLCIANWFAKQLMLDVPTIDKILAWAQSILNQHIVDQEGLFKVGTPNSYGFMSLDELMQLEEK